MVAPESRAAEAGAAVLEDGGNAVEAAIATAASLSATYPHMTGIGGDAFWLVARPDEAPRAVMGCGQSGEEFSRARYEGRHTIPARGPNAAITMAGAVGSWAHALEIAGGGRLGWKRLMRDAVELAAESEIAPSLKRAVDAKRAELEDISGWADTFASKSTILRRPNFAASLSILGEGGPDAFYAGPLRSRLLEDFEATGIDLKEADFARFETKV
ncbi:MAG: gamma-glutamyltransferase, partial [Myxococcota bacterium]